MQKGGVGVITLDTSKFALVSRIILVLLASVTFSRRSTSRSCLILDTASSYLDWPLSALRNQLKATSDEQRPKVSIPTITAINS